MHGTIAWATLQGGGTKYAVVDTANNIIAIVTIIASNNPLIYR